MGPWELCFQLSTSGPRPDIKNSGIKKTPSMVEDILSTLRTRVYLGEALNIFLHLCCARDSRSLKVVGETDYPRLFPCENEASSSNLIQETPSLLLPPTLPLEIQPATCPPWSNKLSQPKPTLAYMKHPC